MKRIQIAVTEWSRALIWVKRNVACWWSKKAKYRSSHVITHYQTLSPVILLWYWLNNYSIREAKLLNQIRISCQYYGNGFPATLYLFDYIDKAINGDAPSPPVSNHSILISHCDNRKVEIFQPMLGSGENRKSDDGWMDGWEWQWIFKNVAQIMTLNFSGYHPHNLYPFKFGIEIASWAWKTHVCAH